MNGIEKITGQIAVDAQKEIDALLQQARDQAAQTAAGYEAQAASQSQAILERGEQEARRRKERLIDGARMEGRRAVLQTKQELVGRAFDLALEKLTGLPEEEYIALLARLAHGVQDGQSRCHRTARAVDIEVDGLLAVLGLQIQQFRHRHSGAVVVDLAGQQVVPGGKGASIWHYFFVLSKMTLYPSLP